MFHVSLWGLTIVAAIAVAAPVVAHRLSHGRLPGVVLEIVLGIIVGPAVLGWVHEDVPIGVLAYFGLGFLFFVAGLEIDVRRMVGPMLRLAGTGFAASLVLAFAAGYGLWAARLVGAPVFVAIILVSTSLGIVTGIVKDLGLEESDYGQLILGCASVAEFGAVMILSLFLTSTTKSVPARIVLVGCFIAFIAVAIIGLQRIGRLEAFSRQLRLLHDKTPQIRIRSSLLILVGIAAISVSLGLSPIVGAFLAGLIVRLAFPDHVEELTYRTKIEGIGYGFLIPVFFIASGLEFDLHSLLHSTTALALVPVFLVALLLVRGLPALLYRKAFGQPRAVALGLFQATSLSFIVPTANLGVQLGKFSSGVGAALIAAGLLSVVLFPSRAIATLRTGLVPPEPVPTTTGPAGGATT